MIGTVAQLIAGILIVVCTIEFLFMVLFIHTPLGVKLYNKFPNIFGSRREEVKERENFLEIQRSQGIVEWIWQGQKAIMRYAGIRGL